MKKMRVLVACEYSGTVRDAFRARGHHAMSCDLLPTERPGLHYQGDVRMVLDGWMPVSFASECDPDGDGWCLIIDAEPDGCPCIGPTQDEVEYIERDGILWGRPIEHPHWDLMVAHPPCTHLAVSGARWFKDKQEEQAAALDFVRLLLDAPIQRIALENPVSIISSRIRKPDQIIQPYEHGHEATKTTCLWLKGLPHLKPSHIVGKGARHVTKSGRSLPEWYNLPPSEDRWKIRSATFPGIANAMADQWGSLPC
ncbi:hypothetical protein UFOVP408_35 [uncultured Caudovirales phage]|uniref:DNA cytosine methyltransferase n=1 Tax=uncultured Caudovirales phage TaxID=2100421 RepID=A0A6J5NDD1_9CAUD|nr:hypothetical protein UFOVP356_58 [uncultured Caudovirales phage]CAB4140531.1 hypothetical protein UFOVP408_35 [uncultured Caudovirales phage]CAB4156933.1 hypothetical protein UFOVP676_38 [uncultured Caudovirales phage]